MSPRVPLGQSRRASAAEALLNIIIGFWISVLANIWLLPFWGYSVSIVQGIEIGILFTLISLLRSYLLRRLFNHFHVKAR
jgi:hypothetical protein